MTRQVDDEVGVPEVDTAPAVAAVELEEDSLESEVLLLALADGRRKSDPFHRDSLAPPPPLKSPAHETESAVASCAPPAAAAAPPAPSSPSPPMGKETVEWRGEVGMGIGSVPPFSAASLLPFLGNPAPPPGLDPPAPIPPPFIVSACLAPAFSSRGRIRLRTIDSSSSAPFDSSSPCVRWDRWGGVRRRTRR